MSPPAPKETVPYVWMKLTFLAEGENVDVNTLALSAYNSSGNDPAKWNGIRVSLIIDGNNNSVYDLVAPDVHLDSKFFDGFGSAIFIRSPLFEVKQRVPLNVLVVITPTPGSSGNFTLALNTSMDVQAKGQISSLSISPTAVFPIEAIEREITP